jgi:DNA-binding transcriptional regulator YiaG
MPSATHKQLAAYKSRERLTLESLARILNVSQDETEQYLSEGEDDRIEERAVAILERDSEIPQNHPGRIIRDIRLHLGWSQETLVEKMGRSLSTIESYEAGRTKTPRFDVLLDIFEAFSEELSVPYREFFEGDRAGIRKALEGES